MKFPNIARLMGLAPAPAVSEPPPVLAHADTMASETERLQASEISRFSAALKEAEAQEAAAVAAGIKAAEEAAAAHTAKQQAANLAAATLPKLDVTKDEHRAAPGWIAPDQRKGYCE